MVSWWEKQGHEVIRQPYYNPELVAWADVIWFDTCDNNLKVAWDPPQNYLDDWAKEGKSIPWKMQDIGLQNKKVICRAIDIEVWHGHQNNVNWDYVDDVIFIAPHIQKLANEFEGLRNSRTKQHVIPCGVDIDYFTFAEHKPGKKIAWIAERWASKGVNTTLQFMTMLPKEYELHACGIWHDYDWEEAYAQDFIEKHLKDRVFITDRADDINEWLEDKNYLWSASTKEAFGYSIAEAASKGIKPIVHHYYGAEFPWGESGWLWNSLPEAIEMLSGDYDSKSYRQYLIDHNLTQEAMMRSFDGVING